jgi:hypothetical protein
MDCDYQSGGLTEPFAKQPPSPFLNFLGVTDTPTTQKTTKKPFAPKFDPFLWFELKVVTLSPDDRFSWLGLRVEV